MFDTIKLAVHSHTNGARRGARPRKPLVQLIICDNGSVHSLVFHPKYASEICNAIIRAAGSAKDGRKRQPVEIEIEES